jgi:hypothetical protein
VRDLAPSLPRRPFSNLARKEPCVFCYQYQNQYITGFFPPLLVFYFNINIYFKELVHMEVQILNLQDRLPG